ncbi:hypothetical protein BGZ83_002565 [Gryganskiella cystojenkinii]|nr:hypothetical protein BGZ83_002565 [Gryganskiella cystojenkinii]
MHARSLLKVLVLAVCTITMMVTMTKAVPARPPPPPSSLLAIQEPHDGAVYQVGDEVHVQVSFTDDTENPLYKDNTLIDFFIQKRIPQPDLNEPIGSAYAQDLYDNGLKFTVLESYVIPTQVSIPFRVRAHFDGPHSGYDDSGPFKIEKN